ncbi:hypothetical protein MMC12_008382 [Toensbergia leucococca]|nr:hypothetical protein [Toensbergia leucococca]
MMPIFMYRRVLDIHKKRFNLSQASPRAAHHRLQMSRNLSSAAKDHAEIAAMLAKPSWSVQSLFENQVAPHSDTAISKTQLHHLLRLSALPLPTSEAEEASMIKNLESQLQFVKAIQQVNTEGVKPLHSIRDESEEAEKENEIGLETLREEFEKEVVVGRRGRIRKKKDLPVDTTGVEGWDALAQAPKKLGRYFVVNTEKD